MDASVLLAEPNEILRKGLSCALAQSRQVRRITEAMDVAATVAAADRERFEVAILGMGFADEALHVLMHRLHRSCEDTRFIVIARSASHVGLDREICSQASGVLCARSSAQELWTATESVCNRRHYWSRALDRDRPTLRSPYSNAKTGSIASLTRRERTVLHLIGQGESNRAIAAGLGLSRRTVDTHRTRLMHKLGIHKTAGLVRVAVREGLVEA